LISPILLRLIAPADGMKGPCSFPERAAKATEFSFLIGTFTRSLEAMRKQTMTAQRSFQTLRRLLTDPIS
jgi:hypothetical protein